MDFLLSVTRASLGILFLIGICYIFSLNKKAINWQLVFKSLGLQVILALIAIKIPFVSEIFNFIAKCFVKIYWFSEKGTIFLFGPLADGVKMNTMFEHGFIFAVRVLPALIFFSALFSLLYYLKILPIIINSFSWLMKRTLKISGAESICAAGNVFLGQSESPLLIKPLIGKLTQSELMCLIIGGFATISGSILAGVSSILGKGDPVLTQLFAKDLLIASILSAPAAILASKILLPETEEIISDKVVLKEDDSAPKNPLDAISIGTHDGLKLAVNVGAMLIVFVSMIAMVNWVFSKIGHLTNLDTILPYVGKDGVTLDYIFGILCAPVAWLLGVNTHDLINVGQLIGQKTVINEMVAYISMNDMINSGVLTDRKSIVIATYALCGFSNFSSIGIMIGGISALAPSRRQDVVRMSMRALLGGVVACLMTGAIAGIFY